VTPGIVRATAAACLARDANPCAARASGGGSDRSILLVAPADKDLAPVAKSRSIPARDARHGRQHASPATRVTAVNTRAIRSRTLNVLMPSLDVLTAPAQ
jgi:hypothetical protein